MKFFQNTFRFFILRIPIQVWMVFFSFLSIFRLHRYKLNENVYRYLNLNKIKEIRWYANLIKGYYFSRIIWHSILMGRPEIFSSIAHDVNLDFIDEYKKTGRGIMLVTAHVGPDGAAADTLIRSKYNPVIISWDIPLLPKHLQESIVSGKMTLAEADSYLYLRAFSNLRNGGVVYIAGDGEKGSTFHEYTLLGETVKINPAVVSLAKKTNAICLPFAILWDGNKLRSVVGHPITVSADSADWEEEWVEQFLIWSENILSENPINWRLYSGFLPYFFSRPGILKHE